MWVLFLLLLCSNAFALPTVTLKTGFAYSTCNNNIVGKYMQGAGDVVPVSDGCVITDLDNQDELSKIVIYRNPVDSFSVDKFVSDLLGAFGFDVNVLPYYSVFKDLAAYKNFSAMKGMVQGLLVSGKLTQQEVDSLNSVLNNQGIDLSKF